MSLHYDEHGVTVLHPTRGQVPLRHEEVAGLSNYEAHGYGLPSYMDATLTLRAEGRIDLPAFRLHVQLEPFDQAHPWLVYGRVGALLFVGERQYRLTFQQWRVFEAVDAVQRAGRDIAARLRAWPALMQALDIPGRGHVLVLGELPHLRIGEVVQFPDGALTRIGSRLSPAEPSTAWAMTAGRRYWLRSA